MKDAFGHGSIAKFGSAYLKADGRSIMPSRPARAADSAAAQALASPLKSEQAPVHDSMAGRASNPTTIATTPGSGGQALVRQRRGITGNTVGTPVPFDTFSRGFRK